MFVNIKQKYYTFSLYTPQSNKLPSSFQFTGNDIKSIINKLDTNKAHDHDISIYMIKLCGDSIYKPIEMIFKSYLNQGILPAEWKKANLVPVNKKGDHQCMKNHRPVSLFPMFSKIF